MNYLALYRKYRPVDFTSLVGQNEIKTILTNAVTSGNITHAYLFSGPRGTGKTTTAKILAKMVNCECLVDGKPCNKCDSCINFLDSNDIIEIDAASNNGIDEIRNLREKANLVPTMSKYKVYIIDEVHMLTTQAFNALLKILEEPPKHVIFILATTEYYKIPLTISSRCQKFNFSKLEVTEIVDKLLEISKNENIDVDRDALYEIAKISDGGMRDSINFLDQLRSVSNDKITIDQVFKICGGISVDEICKLLEYISSCKYEDTVLFFENMNFEGKNYVKFLEDVLSFLRDVILFKENSSSLCIKYDIEKVRSISNLYSLDDIFLLISMIDDLIGKLKFVSRQSIVVVSSFLSVINNLNEKNNVNLNENKYELAFDFTDNNDSKIEQKNDIDLHIDNKNENKLEKNIIQNKEIIINNTFAVASKKVKNDLQNKFSKLTDYLTDKKYAMAVSFLVDTNIEVAGDGYIIFSCKYDAVVDNIYRNFDICMEFIKFILNDDYNIVFITIDEWDALKNEYVVNMRNGVKYEIKSFTNDVDINEEKIIINDESSTAVDRLFELVGDDVIEFK